MRFSIAGCTIQKLLVMQASTHLIHCPMAALPAYVKPSQDFACTKPRTNFVSKVNAGQTILVRDIIQAKYVGLTGAVFQNR